MSEQGPAAKFLAALLSGSVESIARAGAKGLESLAADASKALKKEAEKIENVRQGARIWRGMRLGDDISVEVETERKTEQKEKAR